MITARTQRKTPTDFFQQERERWRAREKEKLLFLDDMSVPLKDEGRIKMSANILKFLIVKKRKRKRKREYVCVGDEGRWGGGMKKNTLHLANCYLL